MNSAIRRAWISIRCGGPSQHLFEHFGFDHTFVQRQVGHEHASTTSLYTSVSSDYQTSELNRVLEDMIEKAVRPKEERNETGHRIPVAGTGTHGTARHAQHPRTRRTATGTRYHPLRVADLPHGQPKPQRISFQLLAALCDIFGVEANELFTFTAADARSKRRKQAAASGRTSSGSLTPTNPSGPGSLTTTKPGSRGRPRSEGDHRCDRCGRWPQRSA